MDHYFENLADRAVDVFLANDPKRIALNSFSLAMTVSYFVKKKHFVIATHSYSLFCPSETARRRHVVLANVRAA